MVPPLWLFDAANILIVSGICKTSCRFFRKIYGRGMFGHIKTGGRKQLPIGRCPSVYINVSSMKLFRTVRLKEVKTNILHFSNILLF